VAFVTFILKRYNKSAGTPQTGIFLRNEKEIKPLKGMAGTTSQQGFLLHDFYCHNILLENLN
jgi:hypothetical protein